MISVIIPSYKNMGMLIKNLKHNLPYLSDCEVIVVNDDPGNSISNDLKDFKVKLIENSENLGFGGAVNTGVKYANGKYIMLLNSDVILESDSFKKSLNHFKQDKVFAVSFAQIEKNEQVVGKNSIYWNHGLLHHKRASDMKPGITAWAEGGSSIIDRDKFLKLNGFDEIYFPFYWEDVDLSYRAWKQGYKVIFDPTTKLTHHHESTIGKYFSKNYVADIAFRNQLIFIWKNITDKDLILKHLVKLPSYFFTKAFWKAMFLLPQTINRKKILKNLFIISDDEILKKFN